MDEKKASKFLQERYGYVDGKVKEHAVAMMRVLHDWYFKYSKEWDASRASLLEIGGGGSLINPIVAAPYFKNIVYTDYDPGLTATVKLWKDKQTEMFDWSLYFNFVYGELAGCGHQEKIDEEQDKLRAKLTHIGHGDYLKDGIIDPAYVPKEKFQVVVGIYCLELDHGIGDNLTVRLKRISEVLQENGFILAIICGEASFWKPLPNSSEKEIGKLFTLTKEDIKSAFEEAGFKLMEHEIGMETVTPRHDSKYRNYLLAQKY